MERKIREVIEKYIVDMFGEEADDNNQKFINTYNVEFAEEIYKIVKGESSMKKISNWEELMDKKISNGMGLIAKVENPSCVAPICNIYTAEDENDPIVVIDWMSSDTPEETINMLNKFGFDLEYKEPFNLAKFLKENIKPKKFEFSRGNYCFVTEKEIIRLGFESSNKVLGAFYFEIISKLYNVEKVLSDNNTTPMELIGALDELGWL